MEITNVIIAPVITEKSTDNQGKGYYSFYVNPKATKIDIKNAVKTLYGADVEEVKTQTLPAKVRKLAKNRIMTKRPNTKKALVVLKGKKPLDFNKLKLEK